MTFDASRYRQDIRSARVRLSSLVTKSSSSRCDMVSTRITGRFQVAMSNRERLLILPRNARSSRRQESMQMCVDSLR